MASLKEIKGRIFSVRGTLKITSAMKMVASSKLHKAQETIENMLPYEARLHGILTRFLRSECSVESPFVSVRPVKRVALVVFSSNGSLCGGFNTAVIRQAEHMLEEYASLGRENILVFPVGRKVAESLRKAGWTVRGDFQRMADKPNYADASALAEQLMELYVTGEIDKVELLYHHFKSTASQVLTREQYLPLDLSSLSSAGEAQPEEKSEGKWLSYYIVEPSPDMILRELLPRVIRLKLYTVLLDSNASEHAARTVAMQTATDNANELLQDLTLLYNKSRQQSITNELLDIIGGSLA